MATPNSYDACLCGHPYSYHDATTPPSLCRFVSPIPGRSCGCQGFGIAAGNLAAQTPGALGSIPAAPNLSGNDGDN